MQSGRGALENDARIGEILSISLKMQNAPADCSDRGAPVLIARMIRTLAYFGRANTENTPPSLVWLLRLL